MSLRSTNRDQLEEISKLVENLSKLNEKECIDLKKIEAVTKNYSEFNARISVLLNTLSSLTAPLAAPLRSNEKGNSKLPPPKTVSSINDGNNPGLTFLPQGLFLRFPSLNLTLLRHRI